MARICMAQIRMAQNLHGPNSHGLNKQIRIAQRMAQILLELLYVTRKRRDHFCQAPCVTLHEATADYNDKGRITTTANVT
jgi:hypothetical protein